MKVLVVGGAGYIGSHCIRSLLAAGHTAVVLDNLSNGHRESLPNGLRFHHEDFGNQAAVARILRSESIELVMHFAGHGYVGESMTDPLKYYDNNVAKTISLLQAMRQAEVSKLIFSSSCTVVSEHAPLPFDEAHPIAPSCAYGQTKADIERILAYSSRAYGTSVAVFRYFNAAGAAPDRSIGEHHEPETHLIPIAIQVALGQREKLTVFGNKHPTPDGTCLRDYVHVDDISRAHIAAFPLLEQKGTIYTYHLGTGIPASVLEIVRAVEKVSGLRVPIEFSEQRPGDIPAAWADNSKARRELNWAPRYTHIEQIIETAWDWHRRHPLGYETSPAP